MLKTNKISTYKNMYNESVYNCITLTENKISTNSINYMPP